MDINKLENGSMVLHLRCEEWLKVTYNHTKVMIKPKLLASIYCVCVCIFVWNVCVDISTMSMLLAAFIYDLLVVTLKSEWFDLEKYQSENVCSNLEITSCLFVWLMRFTVIVLWHSERVLHGSIVVEGTHVSLKLNFTVSYYKFFWKYVFYEN